MMHFMNSTILVIALHSLQWSIHNKDESKRGTVPYLLSSLVLIDSGVEVS